MTALKIDRETLCLIVPVYGEPGPPREDGKPVEPPVIAYVHASPISEDVYDANWEVLSRTFAAIIERGLLRMGPRVASRMMRDVARELGRWDGPNGVASALVPEIRRLAVAISPGARGWEPVQFEDAVKLGVLQAEDADEVEGLLVFFTSSYRSFTRRTRRDLLTGAIAPWGGRIESSDSTAFLNSLRTSQTDAPSGGAV